MRTLIAVLLAALCCTGARAGDPPPTPGNAAPAATGIAHTCLQFYPAEAKHSGTQGNTTMGFVIGEDGTVRNPRVLISSGDASLDAASITCVLNWTYHPAVRAGQAVAVPWKVEVKWFLHDTFEELDQDEAPPPEAIGFLPQITPGEIHGCELSYNTGSDTAFNNGQPVRPTVIAFVITAQGKTSNQEIRESSGSARLDAAALNCVSLWSYRPASVNGKPVSIRWKARLPWRDLPMHTASPDDAAPPQATGNPHLCALPAKAGLQPSRERMTTVGFIINDEGKAVNVHVKISSGTPSLDDTAVDCVRSWAFKPAVKEGKPVAVEWSAPVPWLIE